MGGLAEQLLARAARSGLSVPDDDTLRERCPLLWSLLTQDRYSDGTIRVLPSLVVNRIDGGYSITLQDHASHQQTTAEALTLGGLPEALESILSDPGAFREYKSRKVRDPFKRATPRKPS